MTHRPRPPKPTRRRVPRLLPALLLAACFAAPTSARAFSVLVTDWGKIVRYTDPALTYKMGTYIPSSLGQAGLAAIEAGFAPWTQPSCTTLTFTKIGTTTVTSVLPTGADPNGVNEVIYSQSGSWPHGSYVLGVTVPLYSMDGRIIESDIAFNPTTPWTLSTGGGWGSMNLQGVSTHEIGHFFGLQHVLDYYGWGGADMPTMVPSTDDGVEEITLSTDDQLATCFLYPAQPYTCTQAAQCPNILDVKSSGDEYYKAKFTCTGGSCKSDLVKVGTKNYGDQCPNMWDCVEPYFCQPMTTGAICSQECKPSAPTCPNGDVCVGYQDTPDLGVCLPNGGVTKNELGASCTSAYECDSGLCYPNPNSTDRFCRLSCQLSKADCPAGQTCVSYTGIDYGGCVPDGLLGSLVPLGGACASHADCASGVCGEGVCRKACSAATPCGSGMTCQTFDGKQGCAFGSTTTGGTKADGEPCGGSDECVSGLCAVLPGTAYFYCRTPCVPGGACPSGESCVQYGVAGEGVCMPQASPTGAPCTNNNACTSKICHSSPLGGMVCVAACQPTEPRCAGGQTCVNDDLYGPVCVPDGSTSSGTTLEGAACTADAECASGLCEQDVCRSRCDVFQPACLAGQACFPMGDGNLGACMPSGGAAVGAACAQNLDCLSAFCSGGTCMGVCDRTDPSCPAGESCRGVGDLIVLGVCLADTGTTGGGDGGGSGFCALGGRAPAAPALLLLLLALAPLTLRRRPLPARRP